ncbi:hypothetical protein BBFL7_01399 [Flavobacteria bacterium BBFL7]|nr:hypothetical protein BBFL7_01399 [Flavobacteria bacterium BBFL7]
MRKSLLFFILLLGTSTLLAQTQNALNFDGVDDGVQTSFPGVLSNSNRTFEAWINVRPGAVSSNLCILDYGRNAVGSRNTFVVNGNRGLNFTSGGTNANMSSATSVVTEGQWTHVAFVLDNGTGFIYVNGVQQGTANLSTVNTPSGFTDLRMGHRVPGGGALRFDGEIDEVRIWNVALTPTEIMTNMNSEVCTTSPGLVAYYQFNEGIASSSNSSVIMVPDESGAANGTLNGFSLTGSNSNWVSGPSMLSSVINTEVTESSGILTAQQSGATYRWVRCSDGAIIAGATSSTYVPVAVGFYAAEITFNGCTQLSDCVEITTLGEESFLLNNVSLTQNPSQSLSFIGLVDTNATVTIYTLTGKKIINTILRDSEVTKPNIAPGLYMVTLSQNGASKTFKWIKE